MTKHDPAPDDEPLPAHEPAIATLVLLAIIGVFGLAAYASDRPAVLGGCVVLFAIVALFGGIVTADLIRAKVRYRLKKELSETQSRPEPTGKPSDRVIAELDELFTNWRRRIEHAEELKKQLREEYGGDPAEHIKDLIEDIDETLARHRMRGGDG